MARAAGLALAAGAIAEPPAARAQSALQVEPQGASVLISKDVGGERWAVSRHRADGSVSGNAFFPDGGEPRFVWCSETAESGDEVALACSGADRCLASPCTPEQWSFVADVALPQSFFLPPDAQTPGTWMPLAPLAGGDRQENAVVLLHGEILVVGGFDASADVLDTIEAYDPASNRWRSDVAPLPVPMHHANVAVTGGRLYVLGYLTGLDFAPAGRVFAYDPARNSWSERSAMPAGTERGASGVAAIGGRIYVAGGLRGGTVADFSVYDPQLDAWEALPDVPVPLDHLAAGAVGGRFYVLGGRSSGIAGVSGRVYEFDPATGEWTRRREMPTPRGGVSGATLGGRIYVLGGEGNPAPGTSGVFPNVEAYDPATDTWAAFPDMAVPRHGTGAAGLADRIFVPGGATREGFGAVDAFDVFEPAR